MGAAGRDTWSKTEVRKFIAVTSRDRLHAAWRLSLYRLRRGEVLGLRWSDIDPRRHQLAGSVTADTAYQAGLATLGWHQGGEYLITDELSMPVHPEWVLR